MTELDWKSRISIIPSVCHGRPCIKGTRLWVSLILDLLASGSTIDEILKEYPQIQRADIQACIAYGAEAAREHFIQVAVG
jgi:uncharacterized protein (DUF433 family)